MTLSISTRGGRVRMPNTIRTTTERGVVEHTDDGQGRALIALHGGMGGVDQSWLLGRALLGEGAGWRRIALSRPGYLGTPLETGQTIDQQADAYATLLDALDIDRAVVAAVSAGGPLAITFALRHPERCAGLILVSTPSGWLPAEPRMGERLAKMERMVRIPGLVPLMSWLGSRKPRRAGLRTVSDPALLDRTLADAEAGPLMTALQFSVFHRLGERIAGTRNDTDQLDGLGHLPLETLRVPVLAVHGDADPVVPFHHAERLAGAAPGAQLLRLDGGEHMALFTHLDAVRGAVGAFVALL